MYDSLTISDMETHIISSPERFIQFYHNTLQYPESLNDHIVNKTHADIVKSNNKYENIIPYYINKIQRDATVCRCLFTAKLLYMFRVSIAPIIRSTSNCNYSFWYRS